MLRGAVLRGRRSGGTLGNAGAPAGVPGRWTVAEAGRGLNPAAAGGVRGGALAFGGPRAMFRRRAPVCGRAP